MARIDILGASGCGVTTLGGALAGALGCVHADADDFFWIATDPPYTHIRPREKRWAMLSAYLEGERDWAFSGHALGWAEPLEPLYDCIVFLHLDTSQRIERLLARERRRYGKRIAPGGDMHAEHIKFIDFARAYDTAGHEHRSRALHEDWLARQQAPIVRLDSTTPVEHLRHKVLDALIHPL